MKRTPIKSASLLRLALAVPVLVVALVFYWLGDCVRTLACAFIGGSIDDVLAEVRR